MAAFLAGRLNTVAGGRTFLTSPALVYTGVPIVAANTTSAVAVFPGVLGGALGFSRELRAFDRKKLLKTTAAGGLIGSLLLLVSSDAAFSAVVPSQLLVATLAFAFGDHLQIWARTRHLGIVLLALFSRWGMRDLNAMNGLSFVLSAIFVVAAIVAWPQAVAMMIAATIGRYTGAPLARALPRSDVRAVVIAVGATMSAVFFARLVG